MAKWGSRMIHKSRSSMDTVEAAQRKRQIANACSRIIAESGLEAASLRAIAHELGCTTGVITHYFRDKNAMLDFVLEEIGGRIFEHISTPDLRQQSVDECIAFVLKMLPNTPEQTSWWKVWLAFMATSLGDKKFATDHHCLYGKLRDDWQQVIGGLIANQIIAPVENSADEAAALLALIDGIGIQTLISPELFPVERQTEMLQRWWSRLLRGSKPRD